MVQTCVPCTGRQTLNYWTTREVSGPFFFNLFLSFSFFNLVLFGNNPKKWDVFEKVKPPVLPGL